MSTAAKPRGQVSGGDESLRIREGTTMKKLRTTAFAIAAALAALGPLLAEAAGGYEYLAQRRDQYEIAINLHLAANHQVATNRRLLNYEAPAWGLASWPRPAP